MEDRRLFQEQDHRSRRWVEAALTLFGEAQPNAFEVAAAVTFARPMRQAVVPPRIMNPRMLYSILAIGTVGLSGCATSDVQQNQAVHYPVGRRPNGWPTPESSNDQNLTLLGYPTTDPYTTLVPPAPRQK